MADLEAKLVGEVVNKSGELLVIDPCSLSNFDPQYEKSEEDYLLRAQNRAFVKNMKQIMDIASKHIIKRLASQELKEIIDEYKKAKKDTPKEEPIRRQPYLGTGRGYVVIWTGTDGRCDILQSSNRLFYVSLDEPFEGPKRSDKIIGSPNTETATFVVVDKSRYKIERNADKSLYTVVQAEPGIYQARFLSKGFKVRLQKKE
ncbi:hypothetical protein J4423_00350 [Candidatus Pacearchaeota archaeon]|nr:hypothetical protein [Candidatus Pacearchaeota archaeon]